MVGVSVQEVIPAIPELIKTIRTCPVCLRSEDVRISGRKGNTTQYLCKFCETYFIPSTVYNTHKKIWHDKIFWKRIRLLTKHLSVRYRYDSSLRKVINYQYYFNE